MKFLRPNRRSAFGPRTSRPPASTSDPSREHPVDEAVVLGPVDALEVGHARQVLPGRLAGDPVARQRHGEQLVDEHRPAAVVRARPARPSRPWPARPGRWPAARPRSSRRRTSCSRPAPAAARFAPCAGGTSSRCLAPPPAAPGRGRRRRCPAPAWRCRRCRRRRRGGSAPRRSGALPGRRRCGGRRPSIPARRMCSATASVVDRDWQKNRLFGPPRPAPPRRRARARSGRWTTRSCLRLGWLRRVDDDARSGCDVPCSQREDGLGVAHGRATARRAGRHAGTCAPERSITLIRWAPRSVPATRVDLVDDHESAGRRRAWPRRPAARRASPRATPASSSGARPARGGTGAGRESGVSPCQTKRRSPTISV